MNDWINKRVEDEEADDNNEDDTLKDKDQREKIENSIPVKDKYMFCDICGEKFNIVWEQKKEEWLLDTAIRVEIEEDNGDLMQ